MNKAIYAGLAATLALAAPGIAQQTGQQGGQADAVGDQTTIAVKLASQSRATGNATFTKTKDGIDVKVTTQSAPAGNEVAEIRKGSCASRGLGLNSKMTSDSGTASGAGGVSNSSNTTSSAGTAAGGGTNATSGTTSGNSTSKMSASTGGAAGMTVGGSSANSAYQIGKLKAAQGDQGQPIGAAETVLKNVTLTQLVNGNYAVAIVSPGGGSNAGALCGDLNNALAPTTPATVNKSQ